MLRPALVVSALSTFASLALPGCGDSTPDAPATGGSGSAGTGTSGGSGGSSSTTGGSSLTGGSSTTGGGSGGSTPTTGGSAGAGGSAGGASGGSGGVGTGGSTAGSGGTSAGGGGAGGSSGSGGGLGAGGSVNNVPTDYKGTPFTALSIPGKINAADYDRGGAGVAWCHDMGNCSANRVTGDYPGGAGVYRPPMPANAMICSGAACDDNVGVCRMNPSKPDNTINGQPMPPEATYLCYSVAGEWTKYTVTVTEPGTYAVGGTMAVPQNGGMNLSFGDNITTGNIALAITSTANSGSGENYHSWDTRMGLGTVTFPAAGKYLMTFTQVGRFNASSFTFTKM